MREGLALGGQWVRKFRSVNKDTAQVCKNLHFGYSFSDKNVSFNIKKYVLTT